MLVPFPMSVNHKLVLVSISSYYLVLVNMNGIWMDYEWNMNGILNIGYISIYNIGII